MKDTKELIEIVRTLLEVETIESLPVSDLLGLIIYYNVATSPRDTRHAQNLAACKIKIDQFLAVALDKQETLLDSNNLRALIMLASVQERYMTEGFVADKLRKLDVFLFERSFGLSERYLVENLYNVLQVCNYLLERSVDPEAKGFLNHILARLFHNTSSPSSFWDQVITTHRDTSRPIRFGFHEGLCGLLMMLIQLSDHQPYAEKIKKVIKGGTMFLLSHKTQVDFSSGKYSIFPESVSAAEHNPVFNNKLNWSSSDLNEAVLLYNLNSIFHDPVLLNKANLIGLNTLLRKDEKTTAVSSAKIFDGAAGIALTYYSLFLLSGHASYKFGYQHWMAQTATFLESELKDGLYKKQSSFTHGLTGIFYSLIALEKKTDVFWSKGLLLSHSNADITKLANDNSFLSSPDEFKSVL
jgi:hypothetical protein